MPPNYSMVHRAGPRDNLIATAGSFPSPAQPALCHCPGAPHGWGWSAWAFVACSTAPGRWPDPSLQTQISWTRARKREHDLNTTRRGGWSWHTSVQRSDELLGDWGEGFLLTSRRRCRKEWVEVKNVGTIRLGNWTVKVKAQVRIAASSELTVMGEVTFMMGRQTCFKVASSCDICKTLQLSDWCLLPRPPDAFRA